MTSEKQIQANRRNARKSTGPKTPEGKAIVSLNALKHGLRAQKALLLPEEDGDELDKLAKRVRADLEPVGEMEELMVEHIIAAIWRLRRVNQIETGILAWEYYGILGERAVSEARRYEETTLDRLRGDDGTIITDEDKHAKAILEAREAKEIQKSEIPTLGQAFVKSQDAFAKLGRYQSTIERSLYRSLNQLERLQAGRKARDVESADISESDS